MSRRLTDEEIAERYSQQRSVETPQAGLGTLFGSGVDRAQAAALGLLEPFGLSRDYRLAQQAEAEQSAQRYFETDPEAVGSFRNIRGVGDVGRYAAELGVQTAPAIAPILAAGLVGGPAAAYGVAGLTGIGEITQAQREQTGRPDLTAIPLGLAYGGVEAATGLVGRLAGTGVRAERALARADRALDAIPGLAGAAARTAASFGRTGVSEAVGEVGQEYITNVGRLAVDPNVELFSPEAIAGYQESAVGGALLGGLIGGFAGGWRRSPAGRREFEATQERDMTGGAVAPEQPQYGLVTEMTPLQQRINQQLGIGRRATPTNYVEQFKAAYDEPSGQFATDRETGLERQLSMGELVQLQGPAMDLTQGEPAKTAAATTMAAAAERDPVAQTMRDTFGVVPTPSAISLYNEIQASGIPLDSDLLIDVWKFAGERPMNLKRLDKARLLLDQAIIKARTAAPAAPVVSPPSGAPAVTTPAAPVAVGGSLAAAPAAPVLVTPPAAPAPAPVVRPQPPAPLIDTSDEALETARATGNQALVGEIEALRGEAEGTRVDAEDLTGEQLNTIVQRRFAKSKNPQRDAQILSAYLTALRNAPKGSSVAVQEAIGRQFGIGAQAVRKIGNPSALVAAGKELGYSTEQVLNVLNVDDNTKAQFTQVGQLEAQIKDLRKQYAAATGEAKTAIANQMARANEEIQRAKDAAEQERRAAFSAGLQEAGVETAEGETAGFGFDTDREWAKVEASGDATTQIMQLSDARDALRQALEEFQQVGNEAAVAEVAKRISDIDGQLEKLVRDTTKAAPKVETKAAPDVKAVQQRWKEAGRDITKLTTEDLNVLLPYVRDTIKNTALAKQITDTINSRGGQDAVQVQGAARVPVQPEARAGQEVGRQVRRAEEPAAEGQAQGQVAVRTTQEQYQALTAGFEAPAFTQLTDRQQKQIADLAGRDQLNLAALNRILSEPARITREPVTIDVEARVVDETVGPQVAKLPAPQVTRLENHYGVKQGTPEFLAKVKEDVVKYATQGAQAVAGAIRDIIKAIHAGVLSVAMIFNPTGVSQLEAFVVIPQETRTTTRQVLAELPAEVTGMSEAGKQAYAKLIPALKDKIGDKFITIADKPSARIFVFKSNGELVLQKKALFGLAKGDLYKGNPSAKGVGTERRVTPAGLFGIHVVDAAKGGAAAVTAGEYDFGKVFALDDPDATVTFMHSVWLKEADAAKRAAALRNESAADSRYSFGCINVDKETFKDMVGKYSANMDGSKLFVVPDAQNTVNDFIAGTVSNDRLVRESAQPVTETITAPVRSATQTAGVARTIVGREQQAPTSAQAFVADAKARFARSAKSITVGNVTFQASEYSLDELRRNPGVNAALKRLEDDGLASLVGQVDTWLLVDDNADFDAAVLPYKGGQALAIRYNILQNRDDAEWNVIHELGHIQDGVLEGRNDHSEQPELNIQVSNGKIRPFGAVAREVFDYWKANRNTELGQRLDYPFDATKFGDLDSQRIREELWAQLWSMFINPRTNFDMEEAMPTAFRFMEIEYEAAKQVAAASQAAGAADIAEAKEQARQTAKGDLRASRSAKRARQGLIDRNINKLPQQLRQPANNIVGALGDLMGRGLDYVVFTSDLVGRAVQAGMPAAQRFATALANSKSAASERERRVEKIADMYATIEEANKGSGPGSANEFLFESTRTGKWGYGKYRDAKMGAMFDALGPKAQAFVKAVFQHGDTMLSEKKKIVLDAANSEYDAMIAIAKRDGDKDAEAKLKAEKVATLKRFDSLFKIREGLPYAPIKRSGSWAVVSRSPEYQAAVAANDTKRARELEQNPDHYQVSFVDSKWEARTLQAKIDQEFAGLSTDIVKRAEAMDDFSGKALLPALTSLRAKVDAERGTANTKVLNIISQLYLESLAEDSARKSEMRRRGISGEVDMLSSFTTQGRADANFLASVEYSPEIQDALQQMRSQSKTGDVTRKTELFDEISSRYTQSLDYNVNPWVDKLTSLSSKYFLATSPGYYIQNLTQPFMMSVPAMAGRHDYAKVGQAMWKAYSELGPLFKNTKLFDQQFDFTQVPADVRAAVDELVKRGKIDIGLATEINEFKVDADNKLSQFAQRLNKGMRMAVQKAEAVNRLSTAMAAYRLELAKSGSKDKAIEYADRILTETHGDYTAFNAPRIFNSNFGKIALQFRKFQLIQIAFYAKLLRDAFTKPQERAAALRTLGYSLAHSGVFAGALGLPGYAAVAALSGFLFGDEDEPFDLTEEMRKALGPEWSQLIMRGVPTLAGVDLSGKIGSGQMLSIAPFADIDLTTQAGVTQAIGTIAGGAAGGMAARMLDGLGLIMSGDIYRGTEQVMPKGIGDMLKAGRIAGEGLTRRNGDVILGPDDVSQVGQLFAAIGLPSAKVAETYQARQSALDLEKNFTERATKVKNQYARAFREKDAEGMAEARDAWMKLQAARRRNDLKPQPMSSLLRAPQEQRKREQKIAEQID